MSESKAIPQGYMTVGEVAKKMNVTVRTLQYYDRKGLLSPSAESEGGRRLYTDKDVIILHQILSMKYLGFSLNDIKNRLTSLDTPADVANVLIEQSVIIREKIKTLSETLTAIEVLKEEVLRMQSVDFKKYADIIINLQMKNEMYWMIKHFDDDILTHCRNHFNKDSGSKMMEKFTNLLDKAIQFQKSGVLPESEKGQAFAKEYWDMIMKFTGGDFSILSKLLELPQQMENEKLNEWQEKQVSAYSFIESALDAYFTMLNYNPLEENLK